MIMPTIAIFNASTGEMIKREMDAEELAQYEADKAAAPNYSQEETPTE